MPPVKVPKDAIYITELAEIVNREAGTIRKWERNKPPAPRLPKHLMPKRGFHNWRYWTPAQVHGPRGIIAWMKANDMRPGNTVTDPEMEAQHVANLRRPKFITGHHMRTAKVMVSKGKTAYQISKKIHPKTPYSSIENTEKALRKCFKLDGLEFPPKK